MTDPKSSLEFLLQLDWRRFIEQQLGVEPWVTVYGSVPEDRGTFFCALIPNEGVAAALEVMGWDLMIGNGKPGCSVQFVGGKDEVTYDRLGDHGEVEPLLIVRQFAGLRPPYPEISEEFRLFHNLCYDPRSDTYLKFTESGDEEEVIRVRDGQVQIRLREIRQFLAIKEMHLAIYFDVVRYAPESLQELTPPETRIVVRNESMRYELYLGDASVDPDGNRSLSRLVGKKLIAPLPKEQSGFWPFENRRTRHAEFIVAVDAAGEPVLSTSNPALLSDTFHDRPGTPHYLTPVFFRREVLAKYYQKPSRYSVRDGQLFCASLWNVQIDTDRKDVVVVFLGDLGRDLPYEEQLHWKTYNISPEGGISATNFKRSFLAQFTDPEHPELVFKMKFERFSERWFKKYQWHLFKPLAADDSHLFATLRVPLHDDQAEFDPQVLALTKLLVDSLNEREVVKDVSPPPKDAKGITKFEHFLQAKGMADVRRHIKFLRNLQSLRMGVGHRKGEDYRKAGDAFGMTEKTLRGVFETVLAGATALLDALEAHFLLDPAADKSKS